MHHFDVFKEGKTQSFFESQRAIISLCTYLQELITNMENMSKVQLREHFLKLLQVWMLEFLILIHKSSVICARKKQKHWFCMVYTHFLYTL